VRAEEPAVVLVVMEVARRQHRREDRHARLDLYTHQAVDDGRGDELVPVDAAVDDQPQATIAS
jgi:hypothetical protein